MLKMSMFSLVLLVNLAIQIVSPVAIAMTTTVPNAKQINGEKTITLLVKGMTCPVCPITVKKALKNVPGVSKVTVNFKEKNVIVIFNPQKASADSLLKATADVGYPSSISPKK